MPMTSLPNIFPPECVLNFAGRGDAGGVRYGGDPWHAEKAGSGSTEVDFGFMDGVFVAGGQFQWCNGSFGSRLTLTLHAPATTVEDPETPGTGNCNLVSVGGGINVIVPANGNGSKNLGTTIVPIPAEDPESAVYNGYWNYTDPWLEEGVVSSGEPGSSKYNLFDTALKIGHFTDVSLVIDSGIAGLCIPNIKPKWILPQWKFKITLVNASADKTLQIGWNLTIARRPAM